MNWRITQTDREAGVVMLTCPGARLGQFPVLAEALAAGVGAGGTPAGVGADRHSWLLEFEGEPPSARVRTPQRLLAGGGANGGHRGAALARSAIRELTWPVPNASPTVRNNRIKIELSIWGV